MIETVESKRGITYVPLTNYKNINCFWCVVIQQLRSSNTLTKYLREWKLEMFDDNIHMLMRPLLLYARDDYEKLLQLFNTSDLNQTDGFDSIKLLSYFYLPIIYKHVSPTDFVNILIECTFYYIHFDNYITNVKINMRKNIIVNNIDDFNSKYIDNFYNTFLLKAEIYDKQIVDFDCVPLILHTEKKGHVVAMVLTTGDKLLLLDDGRSVYTLKEFFNDIITNIDYCKIPVYIGLIHNNLIKNGIKRGNLITSVYFVRILVNNISISGGNINTSNTRKILLYILLTSLVVTIIVLAVLYGSSCKNNNFSCDKYVKNRSSRLSNET